MRFFIIAMISFLIAGCASVTSEVRIVHKMPPSVQGLSFYLLPAKSPTQQLEYTLYSNDVAAALIAKGMTQSTTTEADYWVSLTFGVNNGEAVVAGKTEDGDTVCDSAATCEALKKVALLNDIDLRVQTNTVFKRAFSLILIDRAATQRAGNTPQNSYEATATSVGEKDSFLAVSRCMITTVLADFPGKSSRTFSASVLAQECKR